jgi:hypothetical protein
MGIELTEAAKLAARPIEGLRPHSWAPGRCVVPSSA